MNKLLGHIFSVESITAQLQAVLSVYPQDKREQIVNLLRVKPPEERRRMILNIIQNRQVSVCVCVVHVRACACACIRILYTIIWQLVMFIMSDDAGKIARSSWTCARQSGDSPWWWGNTPWGWGIAPRWRGHPWWWRVTPKQRSDSCRWNNASPKLLSCNV